MLTGSIFNKLIWCTDTNLFRADWNRNWGRKAFDSLAGVPNLEGGARVGQVLEFGANLKNHFSCSVFKLAPIKKHLTLAYIANIQKLFKQFESEELGQYPNGILGLSV